VSYSVIFSDGFYRSLPVTPAMIPVLSSFTTHYQLQYQAWYLCVPNGPASTAHGAMVNT